MKYARIADGIVREIIPTLPSGVKITDVYAPNIATTIVSVPDNVASNWTFDGKSFSAPALATVSLADFKTAAKASVDADAETERLRYITAGAGQAMTYQQKVDEAARYLAASNPKPSDYPLLSAEVGITAADIAGVAQTVAAAFAQWQAIGGAIEAVRLGAKKAIDDATTVDAANAAASIAWPTPAS